MYVRRRVISGPCVRPARNSAQPSGVEVSSGRLSDTRTSTTSPLVVVIGPPRNVIAACASRLARNGVLASLASERAYDVFADEGPTEAAAASAPARSTPATSTARRLVSRSGTRPL